jgi:hypothetical protein
VSPHQKLQRKTKLRAKIKAGKTKALFIARVVPAVPECLWTQQCIMSRWDWTGSACPCPQNQIIGTTGFCKQMHVCFLYPLKSIWDLFQVPSALWFHGVVAMQLYSRYHYLNVFRLCFSFGCGYVKTMYTGFSIVCMHTIQRKKFTVTRLERQYS